MEQKSKPIPSSSRDKSTDCNQSQNQTKRSALRLPCNPVLRLQYREIGGLHRSHRRALSCQLFTKLPARLCFRLRNLLPFPDESIPQEGMGHVFLGFSKNGNFVFSYTVQVDPDERMTYPMYVYRLHWWRFFPYKKLKRVAEVCLFGDEDIQEELYIAVCEWPTDESTILIYGYCAPRDNEKHQCYITISAIPPLTPCEDCIQMSILHARSGEMGSLNDVPPRCLNHGYAVHTKYELARPFPSFAPKICLRLDKVLIINTGDSIIAISVDIEDNHGGFGFGLYSPRVTFSTSNLSTASSSPYHSSYGSQEPYSEGFPLEDVENIVEPWSVPPWGTSLRKTSMPKETEIRSSLKERRTSFGKENLLNSPLGSDASPKHESVPRVVKTFDVYAFEPTEAGPSPGIRPSKRLCTSLHFPSYKMPTGTNRYDSNFSITSTNTADSTGDIQLQQKDLCDGSTDPTDKATGVFHKPTGFLRVQTRDTSSLGLALNRTLPGLSLLSPDSNRLCMSPGYGAGSSTCSSCVSSPIILQSDSQCFTYSVRKYFDSFGRPESPSTIDIEDDLSLAYHSILPLDVHGANYTAMKLNTKQHAVPQTPCVVVKQLTLDIEQYLGETVHTSVWGQRYLSFTDYDVQILEVCPDTAEVIALVFVLIRARPPKDKHKHVHGTRTMPKLYQTGFKLIWNLKTGNYTTLDIDDLVEVNQVHVLRKRWQPGFRICDSYQRSFAIPQTFSTSIHVLTNEAVLKGESLKMLLDRHHYVALIL